MKKAKRILKTTYEILVELRRHKIGLIGLTIILIEVGLIIFFPYVADPLTIENWHKLEYFTKNPRIAPPIWASYLFPWERPPTTTIEPQIIREDFYFDRFEGENGYYVYYLKRLGPNRYIVVDGTKYDLGHPDWARLEWEKERQLYSKITIIRILYPYDFHHAQAPVDVLISLKLKNIPEMRLDNTVDYRYTLGIFIHRPDGVKLSIIPRAYYPDNIYDIKEYSYDRMDLRSGVVRELLNIQSRVTRENNTDVVTIVPDSQVVISLKTYVSILMLYGSGRYGEDFVYSYLEPLLRAANETGEWRIGYLADLVELTFSRAEPGLLDHKPGKLNGKYIFEILILFTFRPGEENKEVEIEAEPLIIGGGWGLLGTDHKGRDLWSAIVYGIRWALLLGVVVALVNNLTGALYGVTSAYFGGKADLVMQQIYRIYVSIPVLPILILLSYIMGRSLWLLMGLMIIFGIIGNQFTVRSMALQIREQTYVEAAKALGASHARIILRYIYPQIAPYLFASIALSVPGAILTEAGISVLGLGDPLLVTWGKILDEAANGGAFEQGAWWWVLFPGLAIVITSLAFIMFGQAIERVIEPRLRTR